MANVKLSKEESELVTNAGLILTKNRIITKVYDLFGALSDEYRKMDRLFPPEVLSVSPKISKGENYLGLPWVMLDYPRAFSTTNVFAVRSFFWWGNCFSITLLLQGKYKLRYQRSLENYLKSQGGHWMVGVAIDPWQHHFEADNYQPYSKGTDITSMPFLKLAKKIPLQQWDHSFDFFSATFSEIGTMLSPQAVK